MPKLTITRSSAWVNRMRSINLFLNGTEIGNVKNGETTTFDVPEGNHGLRAGIDWCGSLELPLTLAENSETRITLTNFQYSSYISTVSLTILVLNFILNMTLGITWLIWLIIPIAIYALYFLTFGRYKYLILKAEKSSNKAFEKNG